MLYEFINLHREDIIRRCRAKVASRSIPPPNAGEIDYGVPVFLDQLVALLRSGDPDLRSDISATAVLHGRGLLRQGFTVSQVVNDYGDVCQSITDLAVETNAPISTEDFRTLNRCLDDAIAGAVTEFGRGRTQSGIDGETARGNERLGFLAHELRNLLGTAGLAFDVLKSGNVGVGGSTGRVLERSISGAKDLIARALAETRLSQGVHNRERVLLADFVEELMPAATLEAEAKRVNLTALPVAEGVAVEADRQVLTAVVGNLLQNAFKFTHPRTSVTLRVVASGDRVRIEVEDECGGLPEGNAEDLFRPHEQRGMDRTGLGIGLAFSRWGVEANGGRLYATNVPGKGCIFTAEFPQVADPATTGTHSRDSWAR
jgi:signal transduction histidine kinase